MGEVDQVGASVALVEEAGQGDAHFSQVVEVVRLLVNVGDVGQERAVVTYLWDVGQGGSEVAQVGDIGQGGAKDSPVEEVGRGACSCEEGGPRGF